MGMDNYCINYGYLLQCTEYKYFPVEVIIIITQRRRRGARIHVVFFV